MKPSNDVDAITGAAQSQEYNAYDFVKSYYQSQAFNQRLGRIYNSYDEYRTKPYAIRGKYANNIMVSKMPLQFEKLIRNRDIYDNAVYIPRADQKNKKYSGVIEMGYLPNGDYDSVMAHELGHAVDASLRPKVKNDDSGQGYEYLNNDIKYSDLFPVFRKSKSYKETLNKDFENKDFFEFYPSKIGPDEIHDARPSESYADLMRLRYELYKNGIFDSRQMGKFANKKHLEKLKSTNNYDRRIFDNFSDDDIVYMLNNVASTRKINPRQV